MKKRRIKKKKKIQKRRFAPVLKNLFSETAKSILALADIKESRLKPLPTEIHITKTLRIDILLESPHKIYQIEIHGYKDPSLPKRMFEYYFAIDLKQRQEIKKKQRKKLKEIEQIVIWTGKGEPPPSEYKTKTTIHRYRIVDVKEIPPEKFLNSKNPYEVILALVVGSPHEREKTLPKVLRRLQKISKSRQEFIRYIEEVTIVAKLFDLEVGEKMDWMMKIIEETFPFKEGLRRGLEEGRREGRKEGRKEGEIIGERKGERKGLQEAILLDIEVKFGKDKAQLIKPKIEKIQNIRKLKSLKIKITKAQSWQEFLKHLNLNNRPSNNLPDSKKGKK